TAAGTVAKIFVKAGDKLSVGQRILSLSEGGASGAAPSAKAEPAPKAAAPAKREEPAPALEEHEAEAPAPRPDVPVAAAPSIRKMARDLGIDLTRVRGSARGGRIVLDDVRAYIQRLQRLAAEPRTGAAAGPGAPAKPAAEQIDFSKWGPVTKQALSPL